MIEDIRILTGTPARVQHELGEYLASHPKAAILSSAVTVTEPQTAPLVTLEKTKPAAKKAAKGSSKAASPDPDAALPAVKSRITPAQPVTTVSVIVGIQY